MRRAGSASSLTGGHDQSQEAQAERKDLCKQVCWEMEGGGRQGGAGEEKATGTSLGEEPRHFSGRPPRGKPTTWTWA